MLRFKIINNLNILYLSSVSVEVVTYSFTGISSCISSCSTVLSLMILSVSVSSITLIISLLCVFLFPIKGVGTNLFVVGYLLYEF